MRRVRREERVGREMKRKRRLCFSGICFAFAVVVVVAVAAVAVDCRARVSGGNNNCVANSFSFPFVSGGSCLPLSSRSFSVSSPHS